VVGDSGCTLNFLFTGSDGNRYIGTAGHCSLAIDGEIVYKPGKGKIAKNVADERIGEVAYAVLKDPKDFALIRLDPGVKASAAMCYFGGPTGINDELSPDPAILHWYGNGIGFGNASVVDQPTLPARTAIARDLMNPDVEAATGTAIFGDSGSAVIGDDGRAIGVLVAIGLHEDPGIIITRLVPQVKRAEEMLGIKLKLQKGALESD